MLIRRRVYCARFFVLLLLGLFFAVSQSGAAIQGFSIVSTLPSLSDITAQRIMGSNIHLNLSIQADQGSYRMLAFRNSVLNEVVAQNNEFEHPGGTGSYYLRVPLLEGSNTFFLKLIDLSGKSAEATTATAFIIERDLEFTATEIRLNHIESSSAGVSLYTSDRRVNVFYTINGNAASYEVKFLVNLLTADTVVVPGPGNYSRNSILLTTDSLNTVQLEVRSLDPNGQPLGKQAESNPMRIFQDRTSPTIVDLTTTFQNTTPPAGTPFGPTDLASFGVNIGTDTPFARVSILNETTGDEVTRIAGQNGRITISGIELPKDPSLGDLGITTTAYTALAFDEAGNLSQARQFRVERIAIEPCFNLLRMDPFDGGRIGNGQALTVLGAVCDRNSPHRVVFKIASPTEFSANGFLQEEQIRNLGGGELFDKDISLAINPTAPNEDVTYSIQAQVITTNPLDPTKEEFSKDHDLGVVILDRKPPAPPTVLTARTIFATNSPSFTIDGETEREARIEFSAPGTFSFKPSRTVPAITNEFRSVVDISAAQDGLYDVVLTARDIAGNSGVNSNGKILIKVDRRRPRVKSVAVNDNLIELTRPFFLRPTQNARIRVLVDEPMPVAPRVYVTQQGDFGIEAGLSQVVGDLEFEYQFVVRQSIDGNKDGPVEILVVGGRDDSGNAIVEHREPQAFVVDTLAPGLDRALTKPQDGSIVGKVPSPLRLILREHPKTRVPGSGPFPEMTKIRAFGPIETNPTRVVTGRTEVFDPRSVDFYPSAEEMNLDGTYLFEVTLQDRAGNQFIETLVLELDLEKLSTTLILERFPAPGSFFNPLTLPRLDNLPFASIGVEPLLTPEMNLAATQFEAFNYLRSPQKLPLSLPEVVGTTTIRVKFGRDFTVDGRDDGVITLISRILDTAGNVSEDSVYSWVYDSLAPGVMDGLSFPVPEGFSTGDLRDPPQGALRSGPLKTISSILFDRKTPLGFLGSGLDTSIASTSALTSSTIVLHLDQSFGSVQAGAIVTGRIKFRSDLTQSAPVFGGPAVTRMLFELNVDPITLEPLGLPDDGSMDGVYRMQVQAVDMAQNQSPWSTSWFLYDTVPPTLSLDVNNEVWITSGVIDLRGKTQDLPPRPLGIAGFGSTMGTGVRTVQIKLEAINSLGSATAPAFLDWTNIPLDRNPLTHGANQEFSFHFNRKFFDFRDRVRISLRAMDASSNISILYRELSLDSDLLEDPIILSPEDSAAYPGGIVQFRWKPVTKASSYLLVFHDAEGNQHPFSFLASQVQNDVNLDQLPPGPLFFTVLAIDGSGNRSPGNNGRRLILDQNLPKVSKIVWEKPVASSDKSGRILLSTVRFHITFSEMMDVNSPIKAVFRPDDRLQLTNSFGQSIAQSCPPVELKPVSYSQNQWVGTLELTPRDEFCDYNGIAHIDVSEYKDSAGNRGSEYRYSFELDTGPWFDFRIFSNPVEELEIVFVLKGLDKRGGGLETIPEVPFFQIRQQKIPGENSLDDVLRIVPLSRINSSTFHGTYRLDSSLSGSLRLEITASDRQGNRGTRVLPFQVQQLGFDEGALTPTPVSTGSASLSRASTMISWVFPWYTLEENKGKRMPLFNLLPTRGNHSLVQLLVDLKKYPLDLDGKYAVMECGDKCVYPQQIREGSHIRLNTSNLAALRLIEDSNPPLLSWFQSEEELKNLDEDLQLRVLDDGVGLSKDKIQVFLNNKPVKDFMFLEEEAVIPRRFFRSLVANEINIVAEDFLGNQARLSAVVVPVGPIQVEELYAIPSPARYGAVVYVKSSRVPSELQILIYDAAGRRVASWMEQGASLNSRMHKVLFSDLLRGKSIANGVYFLRARVKDSDGNTARLHQKFAWIE